MTETVLPLPRKTLSVSELTRYLKYLLERDEFLTSLSVHGEVTNLSRSPSGHTYFTLKDAGSQVSCVLFRREALQQAADVRQMRSGDAVAVHGFLTVYEPRGTYQVYATRIVPQGEGALFRRFEQLRSQLEEEGLFASERKRKLPPYPRKLALVTSLGSQAYHDVLHRLRVQYPSVTVIEAGVSVQGETAADEMAMAIDIVNRLTDADVILLVRGGGAPEELAAFNQERLARAVFASRIPVVTGVGHETDYTIVDYVADFRAATPSLAAAAVVPDVGALVKQSAQLHAQLSQMLRQRLRHERSRLIQIDRELLRSSPHNKLRTARMRSAQLEREALRAIAAQLSTRRVRVSAARTHLQALDPLAILRRGYAVLSDRDTGTVVTRLEQVQPGALLTARISDGEFGVRAEEI